MDVGIPISAEFGMPGSTAPISFGKGKVMLSNCMEPYNTVVIDANGGKEIMLAPEVAGEMIAASLSSDGEKIAWHFDTTRVKPNPFNEPLSDPTEGCVGRGSMNCVLRIPPGRTLKSLKDTIDSPGYPRTGWLAK